MRCACGNEIVEREPAIIASAGWCMPSATYYSLSGEEVKACSDCNSRLLMMMMIGIDPGHNGENLKVKRGGIRYERPE